MKHHPPTFFKMQRNHLDNFDVHCEAGYNKKENVTVKIARCDMKIYRGKKKEELYLFV